MIGEKWMKWTFGEASAKTASKMLQKVVGIVGTTPGHMFFATAVVGLVQTIAGFVMIRTRGTNLFPSAGDVVGACLFGLFATLCTVLSFWVFLLDGDIGVNVFILTLSIIPGALIDRFYFKKALSGRQWAGIGVGICAGYCVLGFPSLETVMQFPAWIWLSFAVMFFLAINQGITQKIKGIDGFVKNFWGGATTLVLAAAGLAAVGSFSLVFDFSDVMKKLWFVNILIGFIVIGMWLSNLYSYKDGASIALKKLVMNGSYLTMAMAGGVILFHEHITIYKGAGVLLYFVAFILMDENTWTFLFHKKTP